MYGVQKKCAMFLKTPMDPELLSQSLIEVARRILKLEAQRDELDEQISDAKKEHLRLLVAASVASAAGARAPVIPTAAEIEPSGAPSVRRQILQFVAANAPIEQAKVESALSHLGATTVRQALYDMTSVKSKLLDRTEAGLTPSKKGLEVLRSAA